MKKRGFLLSLLVRFKFSAQMALNGIASNILRTFLTVLGIAIGVASVVSLMGIGEGARMAVVDQFKSLGQNVIIVKSNQEDKNFTFDKSKEFQDGIDSVDYTTPVIKRKAPTRWMRDDGEIDLIGVNQNYPLIRDHDIISGTFFTSLHVKQNSPVAVLGFNIASNLLYGRSPIGRTIKIDGINYRIIGVMAKKGAGNGDGIDDKIIIPYTRAARIPVDINDKTRKLAKNVDEIWAKCSSAENVDIAMLMLGKKINNESRKLITKYIIDNKDANEKAPSEEIENNKPEEPQGEEEEEIVDQNVFDKDKEPITITSLNQLVKQADEANRIMAVLLGGIAAVSLLVGGIGIMNIMLVAVTERTSEIGVRRALGAKQEDLLVQFLLEAVYVSIIGCAVGIGFGAWVIKIVSGFGLEATLSSQSIKIAIGVALSSGLLFGVYPAINASSLQPVEALKRS